jgi:hypothetical protein
MLPAKLYRFSIDRANGRFLSGWCFHRLKKAQTVLVTIKGDAVVIGSITASEYRPDLKEQKLHPTGRCGFDFSLPGDFNPLDYETLHFFFDRAKKPVVSIPTAELEMLRPDSDQRIFFMHIPKTAGTSFNEFARHCFDQEKYATHLERYAPEIRQEMLAIARYLAGHLTYQEIGELIGVSSFDLYALLRDPYKHLHSHLNYVRSVYLNTEEEQFYQYRHNQTIRDFGERLSRIDFSDLAELHRFVDELSGFELEFFDNIQTRYFLRYKPEKVTSSDYDNACNNLKKFKRIGLTEQYDRFRDLFCEDLGLPPQSQEIQSNKSRDYQLLDLTDPDTRKILKPLVEFDLQLYDTVLQDY